MEEINQELERLREELAEITRQRNEARVNGNTEEEFRLSQEHGIHIARINELLGRLAPATEEEREALEQEAENLRTELTELTRQRNEARESGNTEEELRLNQERNMRIVRINEIAGRINTIPQEQEIEGISKEEIRRKLEEYRNAIYGNKEELEARIANQEAMVLRAQGRWEEDPENEERRTIYENYANTLMEMRAELANQNPIIDTNSEEYHRMADVIPELENLLETSDPELEYISIEEIRRRLEEYRAKRDELKNQIEEETETVQEVMFEDYMETTDPEAELQRIATELNVNPSELEIVWNGADGVQSDDGPVTPYQIVRNVVRKKEKESEKTQDVLFEDYMETTNPEAELQRIATELNVDPSELEIVWDGADGVQSDDGPVTPYKIVRTIIKEEKDDKDNSEELRIIENKIKELEELEKLKQKVEEIEKDGKNPLPGPGDGKGGQNPPPGPGEGNGGPNLLPPDGTEIEIPEDPELVFDLDQDRLKAEYERRRNDMYAKYYGDKDYREEYEVRKSRFFEHEIEKEEDGISYKTIEDYEEREEDEQFLLLDDYKNALERATKYEAGDKSVYRGSEQDMAAQFEKDMVYIDTRNHTFNQHEYTQKDLATMGKYGEKMPYIPKQDSFLKNAGRVVINTGILARNIVAPVYRGIGRFVAQPIHRLVTRNKDASPYRNNAYHRMIARRDYYLDEAQRRDAEETRELQSQAEEGENVKEVKHPIRNYFSSRFNALFKSKEGNEAVLRAGAADIKANIMEQEKEKVLIESLGNNRDQLQSQIETLQQALEANPNAKNAEAVKKAIEDKITHRDEIIDKIAFYESNGLEKTKQTDAVSDKQHAVASKEVNTLRTTVIKGVAKGVAVRYVGPKIQQWLLERTKIAKEVDTVQQVPQETKKWVETTYKEERVPTYTESISNSSTMQDIMSENAGKEVTGFYSVYGGEVKPSTYQLTGNEKITSIFHSIDGKGTGMSDTAGLTAPTLTDKTFATELLDANGVLRQDLTVDEIINTLGTNADTSTLADLYVSVGDKYWVKLADLTKGVTEKIQSGEEVRKVVDVAGHYENVTEMVDKVVKTTEMVDNERVLAALETLRKAGKFVVYADGVQDVAENLRNTHTDVKSNKKQPRQYTYDDGTGESIPRSGKEYRKSTTREDDDDQR